MHDTASLRKNKIALSDYDYQRDIENRLLMAQFSTRDLEVLEEILYSPLQIPIQKIIASLRIQKEELLPILEKLSQTGLLSYDGIAITVDKEMRKYYEAEIVKFDEDFHPGMEFLQSLLRKVPIHILPTWYSIPRTSNCIFDSLIEKYLQTPQIFQRYLSELNLGEPLSSIVSDVFNSKELKVSSEELVEKYGLSQRQFEEDMLHLEFNLVCCIGYEKREDRWVEVVMPFHEWAEYLRFVRTTECRSVPEAQVKRLRPSDFAFVEEMGILLNAAKAKPLSLQKSFALIDAPEAYIERLILKLRQLKFADLVDGQLVFLEGAAEWLKMDLEDRALALYRHPHGNERLIREAEKSLLRVLHTGWVHYDDFMRGVMAPLSESSAIHFKRVGKSCRYTLPEYSTEEKKLLHTTIFEWLFETGVVAIGMHKNRECFTVTAFGQTLFGEE